MNNDKLALMIGLMGSLHCLGMCGPLAFSIPVNRPGWAAVLSGKLLYQFGRILSYCTLGAAAGLLGKQIWASGFQQGISILSGCLILVAGISKLRGGLQAGGTVFAFKYIQNLIGLALKHRAGHFVIGVINGFLPCGFVYLGLAGAINMPGVFQGITYMFWFGIGTLPLMFLTAVVVGLSRFSFRNKLNRMVPYAMLLIGVWFILRGLELNLPYISPGQPLSSGSVCK